jgi:type I restriction enzyme S subunit
MTGTSGRQRANAESLRRYEITAPTDERLWKALGVLIDPMMSKVIANAYEARTLAETRDVLLPKLMCGEIRLLDAEKAVEAVA